MPSHTNTLLPLRGTESVSPLRGPAPAKGMDSLTKRRARTRSAAGEDSAKMALLQLPKQTVRATPPAATASPVFHAALASPNAASRRRSRAQRHSEGAGKLACEGDQVVRRTALERTESCPSRLLHTPVPPLTVFPSNAVSQGRINAIPVRLQTSAGLATLFSKLQDEDLSATAVVFDFDKVLANVPGAGHSGMHNPNRIRGGLDTVQTLAMLQARKVPLFIATARSTPALLQDLVAKLGKSCSGNEQSLLKYFIESGSDVAHRGTRATAPPPVPSRGTPVLDPNQGVGAAAVAAAAAPEEPLSDAAARLLGEDPIVINELRNDPLRVTIKRVEGTRVFSAGYDKAKLVAHLITHEIEPERRRIIFVDDNVFHAYFVLQESPGHVHAQQPQRQCTVVSSWWDPSEEQSRGQMMVINDSDFSYTKAYQECLSAFGVDEPERVRTAGILLAKALLRGES